VLFRRSALVSIFFSETSLSVTASGSRDPNSIVSGSTEGFLGISLAEFARVA
jgi:hypothetical protein